MTLSNFTQTALYSVAAGLSVSAVAFSGAFVLWLSPRQIEWVVPKLVALAVGVLLGDAFIHLIPDAVSRHGDVSHVCLLVLAGFFLFFFIEKQVRWTHAQTQESSIGEQSIQPMSHMNLIGDGVHNFIDGILIAGSFFIDPWIGTTTTLAIIAHEIPQEIGDVGALIHGGFRPKDAIRYNFFCSLTVLAGILAALMLSIYAETSLAMLLPLAAGGFIYIAASDFIPSLHANKTHFGWAELIAFATGIVLMKSVVIFEQLILIK